MSPYIFSGEVHWNFLFLYAGESLRVDGLALTLVFHDNSDPAGYGEEEVISWDAVVNPQSGLDFRDLLTGADTLQSFCNVGYALGQEFGVACYVGCLPENCGDIVFIVKEHPIQDEVAHRDDKLQAL